MKFTAHIIIMPLKELLDPQGKAISGSLKSLGLESIENVRVGKHISLSVKADSKEEAHQLVEKACKNLLANTVMESYEFALEEAG